MGLDLLLGNIITPERNIERHIEVAYRPMYDIAHTLTHDCIPLTCNLTNFKFRLSTQRYCYMNHRICIIWLDRLFFILNPAGI